MCLITLGKLTTELCDLMRSSVCLQGSCICSERKTTQQRLHLTSFRSDGTRRDLPAVVRVSEGVLPTPAGRSLPSIRWQQFLVNLFLSCIWTQADQPSYER